MHKDISPAILYFGTPVVLVTTTNPDGSANIAPISSVWWLGWSCMIGLDASSKTAVNLGRTGECVLNLPSSMLVDKINELAKTTGQKKVPLHKKALGYRYIKDKFTLSGLSKEKAILVEAPRVVECPIQLEAKVAQTHPFAQGSAKMVVPTLAFELDILKVHADETLLSHPEKSYIDPDKWHPLIMSFRKFYTTSDYIHPSKLSEGSENQYAPWKQNGWRRKLTQWLISRSTKKYQH